MAVFITNVWSHPPCTHYGNPCIPLAPLSPSKREDKGPAGCLHSLLHQLQDKRGCPSQQQAHSAGSHRVAAQGVQRWRVVIQAEIDRVSYGFIGDLLCDALSADRPTGSGDLVLEMPLRPEGVRSG